MERCSSHRKKLYAWPAVSALIALTIGLVLHIAYAGTVFFNVPSPILLKAYGLFLLLLMGLCYPIVKFAPNKQPDDGHSRTSAALLLLFFIQSIYIFSISTKYVPSYYPLYPTLAVDQGLGWHRDSVFHLSLIQNIINFGYPGTSQHGVTSMVYHALSHYVDASIAVISGADPWESYGLFYYLKTLIFVTLAGFLVFTVFSKLGQTAVVASFLLVMPLIIHSWVGIGSHGLWLGSLLCISLSPYIFRQLTLPGQNKLADLIALFGIVILVSLCKISQGFALGLFIGTHLVLRRESHIRSAVWILIFATFFLVYGAAFGADSSILDYAERRTTSFLISDNPTQSILWQIIALGLVVMFQFKITATRESRALAATVLICTIITLFSFELKKDLTPSDKFYFGYGLYSTALLFSVQLFAREFQDKGILASAGRLRKSIFAISVALLFMITSKPAVNISNPRLDIVLDNFLYAPARSMVHINTERKSLIDLYKLDLRSERRPESLWEKFTLELNNFLEQNRIEKRTTLLFVPKELNEEIITPLFARKNDGRWNGLYLYALTGVPILHGTERETDSHGLSKYREEARWASELDEGSLSKCHAGSVVVKVISLNPPRFAAIECKN